MTNNQGQTTPGVYKSGDKQCMAHHVIHKSLREYMVPLDEFISQVQRVEGVTGITMFPHEGSTATWCVPYPFHEPVRSVVRGNEPQWMRIFLNRVNPIMDNSIPEPFLAMLDGNNNFGVFLHRTTGLVYPFEYARVEGVSFSTIPVVVDGAMMNHALNRAEADGNDELLQSPLTKDAVSFLGNNIKNYNSWYNLQYVDEDGDIFHTPGQFPCLTPRLPIPIDEIQELHKYILNAFSLHTKVIAIL